MDFVIFHQAIDPHELTGEEHQDTGAPVAVSRSQIRSFNPRKNGMPGTRIAFLNGAGLPVSETYDEVLAALRGQ
jgi:hypothetical protein